MSNGDPAMNIQLTKSPIGLDGVPAAETVLSHVDGERGELIIAGEHVGDLAGKSSFEGVTARLWNAATGKTRGEANVRASSARRASAPLRGCPNCCRQRAACRSSTDFAPRSQACAPKRTRSRGDNRRRISGDRGRTGAARQGPRARCARSEREPRRRYAVDAARLQGRAARGRRARRLSRHGHAITA